ncbi:MAG: hypothetical protein AAF432_09570 [Planctomycetota bacterium]
MRHLAFVFLLLIAGVLSAAVSTPRPNDAHRIVQGMTISCPGSGQIWGSDEMVATMAELKAMGVNWIAIHPYGGIRNDGRITDPAQHTMYQDPTWLRRPIEEAHALGLKILIKPHIAYWGSKFSWRGEIQFETEEEWNRFFESYERWILHVAELSHDADAFAVGTELDRTVQFEDEWRDIIAKIRARTDAPLTYAANWDSYQRVTFWDDLDVIGVQGYFPLVGHERLPTERELDIGWERVLTQLRTYSGKYGKKVILAELGYNDSANAAREPWAYKRGGEHAELIQERCLRSALRAIENDDTVVGAFLWKWFPGQRWAGNFNKRTPTMRRVIQDHWREPVPTTEP